MFRSILAPRHIFYNMYIILICIYGYRKVNILVLNHYFFSSDSKSVKKKNRWERYFDVLRNTLCEKYLRIYLNTQKKTIWQHWPKSLKETFCIWAFFINLIKKVKIDKELVELIFLARVDCLSFQLERSYTTNAMQKEKIYIKLCWVNTENLVVWLSRLTCFLHHHRSKF